MKKRLIGTMLGMSLLLTACGGGDDSSSGGSQDTASGGDSKASELFKNNCSGCHGGNLEGGAGPKLSDIGSRMSKADIEKVIKNGQGMMPSEILKGEDAQKVASWLAEKK